MTWQQSSVPDSDVRKISFKDFTLRTSTPIHPRKSSDFSGTFDLGEYDVEPDFDVEPDSYVEPDSNVEPKSDAEPESDVEPNLFLTDFNNERDLPDEVAPSRALDSLGRLIDLGRDSLRKPDISIVHQSISTDPLQWSSRDHISHGNDKIICMVENKLKDKKAAVKQLEGYAKDYGYESSPLMRLFTFVIGDRGLEVELGPIILM
jgi:hypothetical protein